MDPEEIRNWKKVKVLSLLRRNPLGLTRDQLRVAMHYSSKSTLIDTIRDLAAEKLIRIIPTMAFGGSAEKIVIIHREGDVNE